jgi:glycosyltransferase involved in cell wall biosynthesis
MRILHVINQFSSRAGAEVSLRDIVLATQGPTFQHGITVLRIGLNQFGGLADAGIPTFEPAAALRSTAARIQHVRRAIRGFRPDLVHTTLFDADVAGRVAAKVTGVRVLTSLVNTPYVAEARLDRRPHPFKMRVVHAVDVLLSRYATTAFHAIAETVAESAVEHLGIDPSRITVVPRGRSREALGISTPERRARARRRLRISEDAPVLINVARQEAQKGQRHLLQALVDVRQDHPGVVLLLVGRPGAQTPVLTRSITALGLRESVRMLGVRRDVPELLCAADVFVFPSLYEGLGGAVLEAMALRVPIVASDVPALSEVLVGGQCGLLVPISSPAPLASAIKEALNHPKGAAARVDAAATRFDSTYELAVTIEGMRRLYQRLA